MAFYEVFFNYNVFYRLRVCNKVYMGYSLDYFLGVSYINLLKVYRGGLHRL